MGKSKNRTSERDLTGRVHEIVKENLERSCREGGGRGRKGIGEGRRHSLSKGVEPEKPYF